MEVNLRCDRYFVEDGVWERASIEYSRFIRQNRNKRVVFLELGVGMNTPGIIKYPFWQMVDREKHGVYICINQGEARGPEEIREKCLSTAAL